MNDKNGGTMQDKENKQKKYCSLEGCGHYEMIHPIKLNQILNKMNLVRFDNSIRLQSKKKYSEKEFEYLRKILFGELG